MKALETPMNGLLLSDSYGNRSVAGRSPNWVLTSLKLSILMMTNATHRLRKQRAPSLVINYFFSTNMDHIPQVFFSYLLLTTMRQDWFNQLTRSRFPKLCNDLFALIDTSFFPRSKTDVFALSNTLIYPMETRIVGETSHRSTSGSTYWLSARSELLS